MCGLVVTTLDLQANGSDVSDSLSRLACRGPDAVGLTQSSGLTFGHRRLAIIGLGESGAQPVVGSNGDVLVFNGEIYNYQELAREIGVSADSDTRVLYELFRMRDYPRINRLRGMFALAFWDDTSGELITLRDPFGVKPLYVRTHERGQISIGSTPACLAVLGTKPGADPQAIVGFLASGYFRVGESAFDGIAKLPAGEIVTWRRGSARWSQSGTRELDWSGVPTADVRMSLEDSVKAHLVADVPVGVLLSGGVDSTLISALAVKHTTSLKSFSLTNPEAPEIDEAVYARRNAELIGLDHTEVPITPDELAGMAARLVASSGEPFSDPGFLALSALSEVVARSVKVALAGEGADELFGGYRRYGIERRILKFPSLRFAGRAVSPFLRSISTNSRVRRSIESAARGPTYRGYSELFSAAWDPMLASFPHLAEASLNQRERAWRECTDDPFAYRLPRYQAFDLCEWLSNTYLEKSDRASMLHSLEIRVPFMDRYIAASVRGSSPQDSTKAPLREFLTELVPGVSLPPKKMGLTVDATKVLYSPALKEVTSAALADRNGLLRALGTSDVDCVAAAAAGNAGLKFRLVTLNLWAEEWL